MSAFPKTRAAAAYAARHHPGELTRAHAAILLARLDAYEDLLSDGDGDTLAALHGLLRELVVATGDLAGPAWLKASSDDPDVAAFTALRTTASPPDPASIDQICSTVLWARYGPSDATQDDPDRDSTQPAQPGRP